MNALKNTMKVGLACLLVFSLGLVSADEYYGGDVEVDIDREVHGWLWIADATVNLHENAWVKNVYDGSGRLISAGDVYTESGATLNIFGGRIDSLLVVTSSYNDLPEPFVTVYGSEFAIDGYPVEPGTLEVFLQNETLSGVYESGTEFAFNVECFWEGSFYLTVKLGWVTGAAEIAVDTDTVEFGQVDIGNEHSARVTITNVGSANLSLQSLNIVQDGLDFGFMPLEQLPVTLEPDGTIELEVVFAPTYEGPANAVLKILSDDPENPVVEVLLTGAGHNPVLTPAEQITMITRFYGDGLKDGTIAGIGPGKSGRARAMVIGQTLVLARNLINSGHQRWALIPLLSVEKKTNGANRPPDFVAGADVPVLNAMINDLIADIRKN